MNLQELYSHGRLGGTGYLSILPVDQGIEHTAGASFSPNPIYFQAENIIKLAMEGGCSGVATTFGNLGILARKYAHKIPFIVKINHNELMTYPNKFDQISFGTIKEAFDMGARFVGATVYFGSEESNRQIVEISEAFEFAHELGMGTILWCYLRNDAFNTPKKDYNTSADATAQACHLGYTMGADILKQKLPTNNGAFKELKFAKYDEAMYTELCSLHPIDLTRWQVLNCGGANLINSGGASGENDKKDAIRTAVINKRAGGAGLIMGRKAFQKPIKQGVELIHTVQDVYRNTDVKICD